MQQQQRVLVTEADTGTHFFLFSPYYSTERIVVTVASDIWMFFIGSFN